jgi:hypothetical protein
MKLLRDFKMLNESRGAQFDEPPTPYDDLEGDNTIDEYIKKRIDMLRHSSERIGTIANTKFAKYKVAPPGTFGAPPEGTEIVRINGQNYNISAMDPLERKEIERMYAMYGHNEKVRARLTRHIKKYVPSELATAAVTRGSRNPEEEKYIMKSPSSALSYAQTMIKGRWPEAL